jgi:hypothetical protein
MVSFKSSLTACFSDKVTITPYSNETSGSGRTRYVIHNPHNGKSLLTNDFGKSIAESLLQTPGVSLDSREVQNRLSVKTGKLYPIDKVEQMLHLMVQNGIALPNNATVIKVPPRLRRKGLYFYFGLFDLDKFLKPDYIRWWNKYVAGLVGGLSLLGLLLTLGIYTLGKRPFPDLSRLTGQTFWTYGGLVAGTLLLMVMHELAHALVCKYYGLRVGQCGFVLIAGILPGAFVDTSSVYTLSDRRQRLKVSAAGPALNIIVAGCTGLGLLFSPVGSNLELALMLGLVFSLLLGLYCLYPLGRDDGYFMLCDWLGEPNLRGRAFSYILYRLRRQPYPTHMQGKALLYCSFAIGTSLNIALLVYTAYQFGHQLLKLVFPLS